MTYLDTNVLLYALCKNIDNQKQKEVSQDFLRHAIKSLNLLVSEIALVGFKKSDNYFDIKIEIL